MHFSWSFHWYSVSIPLIWWRELSWLRTGLYSGDLLYMCCISWRYFNMTNGSFINRYACKAHEEWEYCIMSNGYNNIGNRTKGLNHFNDLSPLLYCWNKLYIKLLYCPTLSGSLPCAQANTSPTTTLPSIPEQTSYCRSPCRYGYKLHRKNSVSNINVLNMDKSICFFNNITCYHYCIIFIFAIKT